MTVLEVIQRSSEFLAKRGVDLPRLQAELLLAHVLGLPRMKLYLDFDRRLSVEEKDRVRQFVKRRGDREPLQHIVGSVSFCGLELAVSRDVLIPRPETELLAERAVKFLQERPSSPRPSPPSEGGEGVQAVLDFGTGSGCLAIVIAARAPASSVQAVDISEAALNVARQNAARHQMEGRIRFYHGDGFAAVPPELRFDLIVSNPPYIASAELEALQPEVRDHDPRLALDGGADGLDFFRRLAAEAGGRLNTAGRLMVELGDEQDAAVRTLLESQRWRVEAVENDDTGRPRILIARRDE